MSFHGLHLPRPSQPDAIPPVPSSSSPSSSLPPAPHTTSLLPQPKMRAPPPSFAHQRQQARALRADKVKSPFVPKKTATARGKERDLSLLSVEQLGEMLERNARLLESPETLASLPGGDARLRTQQGRIQSRLRELEDVRQIKDELAATRLSPVGGRRRESGAGVKREEEEEGGLGEDGKEEEGLEGEGDGEMDGVEETGVADEASSPLAKRRIAAQLLSTSPHSLPLALSLTLQRAAVERDRAAQVKKQAKMELDAQRPEKTGALLRGAVGVDSALGEFLFQNDSDASDAEPDEATLDSWLAEGRKAASSGGGGTSDATGQNGQLDEEEDANLNPLRTAYMEGWNRAVREEKGE
ncbi:hypothetical protein JCM6882_005659 [Rhodosporidiobolus microsporus]